MAEATPQQMMTPPTLASNKASGGQNPTNKSTGDSRPLPTIGSRD